LLNCFGYNFAAGACTIFHGALPTTGTGGDAATACYKRDASDGTVATDLTAAAAFSSSASTGAAIYTALFTT